MAERYGVPYKGSKNQIAEFVVMNLPKAETLVDVFAGGCAITHAAMKMKRYRRYVLNDLHGAALTLFARAIRGEYRDETRWISREDFKRLKDTDPYVAICWSFGNNTRDYLYGATLEPYKKACHYAVVLGDFSQFRELCSEVTDAAEAALAGVEERKRRRVKLGRAVVGWLKANGTAEMVANNPLYNSCHRKSGKYISEIESLERLQSLESLQSLERLESLQSLQSLPELKNVATSFTDYREVTIPAGAVIYCDPPYKDTKGYIKDAPFDHEAFYDWCCAQKELVVVSEYNMPADRFVSVAKRLKSVLITGRDGNGQKTTEQIFVPRHQEALYRQMMQQSPGTQLSLFANEEIYKPYSKRV